MRIKRSNPKRRKVEEADRRRGRGVGMGRRRIEIKKIHNNKTGLIVTFSKRRAGLFKKALEFCNLCGVEVAVITFSPSGRAFSFGKPSSESVVLRYLNQQAAEEEAESEEEEEAEEEEPERLWWEKGIEDFDSEEVKEHKEALAELKRKLVLRIEDIRMRADNSFKKK